MNKNFSNHQIKATNYLLLRSIKLTDAYTDFMLSRRSRNLSPRTIEFYSFMLGTFITWAQSSNINSPEEISARYIRQFLFEQQSRKLSDYTIHGYARAIRAFVHFLFEEEYIPKIITFDMPKIKARRLPTLDANLVLSLLNKCDKRAKAIILFMIDTGVRLTELTKIRQCDIDLLTGRVKVIEGKGGKDRIVAVGFKSRRAILAYQRHSSYDHDPKAALFQTVTGKEFSRNGLSEFFKRLTRQTGIPLSAHVLRRTFAILSLRAGMSPLVVQDLMGHSDLTMTKHYAQLIDDDLLENHRSHSPVDNLKKLK